MIGKYLDRVGRKNAIILGDILLIVTTIGLGATAWVEDPVWYLVASIACRFMQGLGNALVQTACKKIHYMYIWAIGYAIITFVFADNREKYLGYAEAATGMGLMIGPVIGGFIYAFVDFFWTFAIFGVILAFSMLITVAITPNALNQRMEEEGQRMAEGTETKKVSYSLFLLNKRAMFAFFSCGLVSLFTNYQSAFLTDVLSHEKHVPEIYNGFILALPCLTFTISCICVNLIITKLPRRIFILLSFLMLTVSLLFQGPSLFLAMPDRLWILLCGYALNGLA